MSLIAKLARNVAIRLSKVRTRRENSVPDRGLLVLWKTGPNQTPSQSRTFKAFVLFCSGYLTYKLVKERFRVLPQVSAASPLAGRRQQFNFIADVVEKSAPAVVYIEIRDPRWETPYNRTWHVNGGF